LIKKKRLEKKTPQEAKNLHFNFNFNPKISSFKLNPLEVTMKKDYMKSDMNAEIKDYQAPNKAYSQSFDGSTLDYVSRQDKMVDKEASMIRKQDYKGRYQK